MSVELFDVVLLIEDGRHVSGVRSCLGAGILVGAEVQREVDDALLAVKVFLLEQSFKEGWTLF